MHLRRNLLAVLAASAVGCATVAAGAAEVWKAYTYNPSAAVAGGRGLLDIAKEIEKATNGELKIQVHLGGSLPIKTTDITQAVGDGIVQFAADGFYLGNVTIGGILRLPMLIASREEFAKAEQVLQPYLEEAFAERNCVILGQYLYPLQVAWANTELTKLADLKGKKMRVTSPEQAEFVKRYGGFPITLGAPEVPTSLQRGVVEGVFTASAGGGKLWADLLKYNYRLGPNFFSSVVIANKQAFAKLTPETQAKLRKVVADIVPGVTAQMKGEEDELTKKFAANGMVVTEARPEDIADAGKRMADFWDAWAKQHGPKHVEALAKVRAALGR